MHRIQSDLASEHNSQREAKSSRFCRLRKFPSGVSIGKTFGPTKYGGSSDGENQEGIALILALVVVALLAVLIIEFNYISRVESSIVRNWENERRAYYLAKGGVNFGIYLLKTDDPETDSLIENWAAAIPPFPVDDGVVELEISDEDGKINVNKLIGKGKLSSQLAKVTARLFQLFDIDSTPFPLLVDYPGGDSIAYEPFDTKSELLEFSELNNVVDFLTIYSSGKININTAPAHVIQSLSDRIDEELAQAIVDYRTNNSFTKVTDLGKVPGVTDDAVKDAKKIATVKSGFFTVKSTASVGECRRTVEAVVERGESGLDIVYWRSEIGG